MRRPYLIYLCGLVVALFLTPGCSRVRQPELPEAHNLGPRRLIRQKVIVSHGGSDYGFDAVLQIGGDSLLLLGLTPMGTKAFMVRQQGPSVEVKSFVGRPLPAPPESILRDVHRAYLSYLSAVAHRDGWVSVRIAGEWLRQRWSEGLLYEVVVLPRRGGERTSIRYPAGLAPGRPPEVVVLDHPSLGLKLEIRTLEVRDVTGIESAHGP